MKRILSLVLIITFVFGMTSTSFGLKFEQTYIDITDGISGKSQKVPKVNLIMGGKEIHTAMPPILYTENNGSMVFVPIEFFEKYLDKKAKWNEESQEVTLITKDKTVTFKINSREVVVNGNKITTKEGIPPKLLKYEGNTKIMIPLKFMTDQLGMKINWIPETFTATVDLPEQNIEDIEFQHDDYSSKIFIKTTGPVEFSTMYLPESRFGENDKLIIDIPNTRLIGKNKENGILIHRDINMKGIISVKGSIFESNARKISRIVIDLAMKKDYQVEFNKELNGIVVDFSEGVSIKNGLNKVNNISSEKREDTDTIVIETEEEPKYNLMNFGNKLIVDIVDARLSLDKNEIPINKDGIERIRVAQFAPDDNYEKDDKIVRVVLDLEDKERLNNIFVEKDGTDIVIYTGEKSLGSKDIEFDGISYERESINTSYLRLTLKELGTYSMDYVSTINNLIIKVPKNKIQLKEKELDIDDSMIDYIRVEEENNNYYIRVQLKNTTDYYVENTDNINGDVIIVFKNRTISTSNYGEKLVIIDPGHGGIKPGTQNLALGLVEKNLNLDTAKRLDELLKKAGFKTYMTRTEDIHLGLYERSDIANALDGTVFVSMHYNAVENNPEVSGLETLYVNHSKKDSKTFATIIQEEMVKSLKRKDRGIIDKPGYVVIRETNMPSVIVEGGFVTNQTEGSLIATPEYRQNVAQAVFNGIKRYYDEVLQ